MLKSRDPFRSERPLFISRPAHSLELSARRLVITQNLKAIRWSEYDTAYGCPQSVPKDLKLLLLGNVKQALKATHRLWSNLCHQHAYISTASEPALPFLLEAFENSQDAIRCELLDIFLGFSLCAKDDYDFSIRVLEVLKSNIDIFSPCIDSSDEDMGYFARELCSILNA